MDPAARRHETLLAWRSTVAASDGPVPTPEDLRAIAVAGAPEAWPPTLDSSTVERWRPTIEWLLRQVRFGVSDPVAHLPTELTRPLDSPAAAADGPGGPPQRDEPEDPEMAALRSWRDRGVARGEPGFSTLRDNKLRLIVGAPTRDPAELAKLLGHRSLRRLSGEVANVLNAARSATPSPAGAGAAPAAAPRAPLTVPTTAGGPAAPDAPTTRGPDRAAPAEPAPPAAPSTALPARADERATPASVPEVSPRPAPSPAGGAVAQHAGPPASDSGAHRVDRPADAGAADDFDPYDYSADPGVPVELRVGRTPQGGCRLTWPEWDSPGYAVFRVVSGDEFAPYTPESGEPVAVTTDTTVTDDRPFETAVRHYAVWRNTGPDRSHALRSQPQAHAAASVVAPVLDVDVRADGGRVIGQWQVLDGVDEVHVYRIPIARAAAGLSPEYRILADEDNLEGFVDAGVTRGERYSYRVCAVARVDGVSRLSTPVAVEVAVSAVLAPVDDLQVEAVHAVDSRVFVLRWTPPPAGRVFIYRSPRPPLAGATAEARPVEALPQMQLEESDRLTHPVRRSDGGASMREVPWPDGWTRAYFTPVTVLDGTARVGTTAGATWVPPATVPRLVERVDRQLLTFAWPPGAAAVVTSVGPRGTGPDAAQGGGRTREISEAQYRDLGGLTFPFVLPAEGCAVHIVPVAFASGERVEGVPVTVDYAGLLRMRYTVAIKRNLVGRPTTATVEIRSEVGIAPPPFVLVHNVDRLPLGVDDGTLLEGLLEGDETLARTYRPVPQWVAPDQPSRWRFEVKGLQGYVRLFADLPPERLRLVALLDPPVDGLRLEPRFGGVG